MLYYLSLVVGSMSLDFYQIDTTIRKESSKVTKEVSHTLSSRTGSMEVFFLGKLGDSSLTIFILSDIRQDPKCRHCHNWF